VEIKTQIHTNDAFSKVMMIFCHHLHHHHHHHAKVHALLFTKIICKRCSVCDPAQYKLDEENPIYAGLAQEISFGSAVSALVAVAR
jgi:hypothetical protein